MDIWHSVLLLLLSTKMMGMVRPIAFGFSGEDLHPNDPAILPQKNRHCVQRIYEHLNSTLSTPMTPFGVIGF